MRVTKLELLGQILPDAYIIIYVGKQPLLTYCLWLPSWYSTELVTATETIWPTKPKIFTIWPLLSFLLRSDASLEPARDYI